MKCSNYYTVLYFQLLQVDFKREFKLKDTHFVCVIFSMVTPPYLHNDLFRNDDRECHGDKFFFVRSFQSCSSTFVNRRRPAIVVNLILTLIP